LKPVSTRKDQNLVNLGIALIVTFLLLLCLYWAPRIGRNQIHPVFAQLLGVGAVGAVYTCWAVSNGGYVHWSAFWLFFIAGGLPSFIGLLADKLDMSLTSQEALRVLRRRGRG
jgi:hypothetical protein